MACHKRDMPKSISPSNCQPSVPVSADCHAGLTATANGRENFPKLEQIGFYTLSDYRAEHASVDSQMMRGEIIITEYCNFRCPYCRGLKPEVFGDRPQKQLSLDEVKLVIDSWCSGPSGLPIKNIRFSGGEPTLHKDIVEIIAYAKLRGVERIAISTNGASKTELYHKLIDAGANDFSISLDACCAEVGDKMAGGVKGAFEKVIHNIREISARTYVTVGVVLTPENISEVVGTIELAHNLGVSDIRIITAAQFIN
jgi:cyclic pyranopterin phosphate synthase